MSESTPANDETKTALENAVRWYLNDKLASPGVIVATQKYLTQDNRLIYLTSVNTAESAIAKVKIQVLERVEGGVHETGYQLYSDHRLERYQNAMIFGTAPDGPDTSGETVSETEAQELLALISALQTNARALI